MALSGRMRELIRKYGKVALGVHLSVSAVSIAGLYTAINNNVDVEAVLHKVGLSGVSKDKGEDAAPFPPNDPAVILHGRDSPPGDQQEKKKSRTAELVSSSGGALALAILCNKALFPVRVPITIALTPPVARFLRARNLIKSILGFSWGEWDAVVFNMHPQIVLGADVLYDTAVVIEFLMVKWGLKCTKLLDGFSFMPEVKPAS